MNSRNQSLDILRGVAVLLVLCDHYPLVPIMKAGGIGVDLFFVLSGFLISGLLFQEYKTTGGIRVGRFIVRRGFKIWPALYVFLAAMYVFARIFLPHIPMKGFVTAALFVVNYFPRSAPVFLGPLWSLSVEEHFYILLPLLMLVLVKSSNGRAFRSIPAIFALVATCCLALRLATPDSSIIMVNRASHLRIDSLFAGVALAYLYHFRMEWFSKLGKWPMLIIAAACIAPALLLPDESRFIRTVGLTLNFAGFGLLLAWAIPLNPKDVISRVVAKIGLYSYSIYLWHRIVSLVAILAFGEKSLLGFTLYVLTALGVGTAMSKAVEIPMLRVRENLFQSSVQRKAPDSQPVLVV